jgi:cytochrome c oxidase subunit II
MPPAVRRLPIVASALAVLALVAAGVAAAANGGFTPVTPHSPNASDINDAYYLILGFTAAIFVIVETALVVFVIRFRSRGRPRDVEGPQIIGHTRIEVIWTVVPVLILAAIAAFVFVKLPSIKNVPASSRQLDVQVQGHQFYWRFVYPDGVVSYDRMVVPANRVVALSIVAADVAHSWWIPALGGKMDAIPGRTNHSWFEADGVASYDGQCAELCGLQHALMKARVQAVSEANYEAWTAQRRRLLAAPNAQLGAEEVGTVCAKCHNLSATGPKLFGPNLGGNPLLLDRKSLTQLVTEGRGQMPAVAKDWSDVEINSLISYFRRQQRQGGGGSGG